MPLFNKTLNVRLLAILLVSMLLGGAAIHGLHEFQVRRQAGFFLDQARKTRDERQFLQALNHFDQYLRLRPDDVEALEEFGLFEADVAELEEGLGHAESAGAFYTRAYFTLENLLGEVPQRDETRRRLVKVAMRIGRFSDAVDHLQQLLGKKTPEDVELLELLAECQVRQGDYPAADQTLKETIEVAPDRFASYDTRARLLRERLGQPGEADGLMKKMVDTHPQSAPAWVVRAGYYYWLASQETVSTRQQKSFDEVEKASDNALDLDPDNVDALWFASFCCLQKPDFDGARDHARHGVELDPKAARMYLLLAEAERNAGGLDEAIAALQQGLEQLPNRADLLWTLANLCLNPNDFEQAREATGKLAGLGPTEASVKYLEGGVAYFEAIEAGSVADWPQVQAKLDAARTLLTASSQRSTQALAVQVDYWLGECYGHLRQPDLQMACYRRALEARPDWTPPRIALAGVLTATGKIDEALKQYEFLWQAENVPASVLIRWAGLLARKNLLIQRNSAPNATRPDWAKVDLLLDRAAAVDADSGEVATDLAILRAESLRQQGKLVEAKAALEDAREKRPKEARIWTALAAVAEIEKAASEAPDAPDGPDEAAEILDQAQREIGDCVALRIARALHLAQRLRGKLPDESKRSLKDQLRQLADQTDQFSDDEKVALWQGLMEACIRVDQMGEAKRFCNFIAELRPENLPIRLTLLELVRRTAVGDAIQRAVGEVEKIAVEIGKIEDSGPRWHYAEALRLRLSAGQTPDLDAAKAILNEALDHLNVTEKALPRWASEALLAGEIHDRLGNAEGALEQYSKAIQLGSRDLTVLRRTTELLDQQRRYADVDSILHLMQEVARARGDEFPMGLEQLQAESSLRGGNFDEALTKARAVAAGSEDFNDHVWLARVLITIARPEPTKEPSEEEKELLQEAEQSLRNAIKLAPAEYRPRAVLIQFLAATGRIQEVGATLQEARQAVQDPLALAQLYKDIGNWGELVETYEAELAGAPDDPGKTSQLINAYVRADKPDLAEPLLRKVLDGGVKVEPTEIPQVRRVLIEILVKRGGRKNLEEAAGLIRKNLAVDAPSTLDRRALAHVLAMAPEHAKRAEAIRLLEQLVEAEAAPEDQFLLATLYSKTQGNWPQARSRMIALLASHGDRPGYVASYVEALLDRKEISEAELWLKRLEELSPGSLDTRGLRARAKVERKEFDEAVAYLIEPLAKPGLESSQRDRLLPAIASLLEQLSLRARENDQQEGAEKLAAEAETLYREHLEKAPEDFLRLASFLGRQNRPQEALELIEKAAAQDGGSTRVLLIRADFQIALEQFGEVETLYRKVLDDDPDDVIAMNNLAVLLALEGKQLDEALRLIDRAIELAGAGPTMLDSRATVHLARKELPKALADMEGALEDPHTPTRLFHLAQIKDRMNDRPGARRALGEAEKLDLDAGQLHPLERPVYDALKKKLSADGS